MSILNSGDYTVRVTYEDGKVKSAEGKLSLSKTGETGWDWSDWPYGSRFVFQQLVSAGQAPVSCALAGPMQVADQVFVMAHRCEERTIDRDGNVGDVGIVQKSSCSSSGEPTSFALTVSHRGSKKKRIPAEKQLWNSPKLPKRSRQRWKSFRLRPCRMRLITLKQSLIRRKIEN